MDVAFGMEYLHGKNIVHFDLKSDNLLVNLRDPHRPICKVSGFILYQIFHFNFLKNILISGNFRRAGFSKQCFWEIVLYKYFLMTVLYLSYCNFMPQISNACFLVISHTHGAGVVSCAGLKSQLDKELPSIYPKFITKLFTDSKFNLCCKIVKGPNGEREIIELNDSLRFL